MLSGSVLPCFSKILITVFWTQKNPHLFNSEMIVHNEVIEDSNLLNIIGKSEFCKIYLQFRTKLKSVETNVVYIINNKNVHFRYL